MINCLASNLLSFNFKVTKIDNIMKFSKENQHFSKKNKMPEKSWLNDNQSASLTPL